MGRAKLVKTPCTHCHGSGRDPLTKKPCPICHGKGYSIKNKTVPMSRIKEQAPTNSMGGSSSLSGPIAMFDPNMSRSPLKRRTSRFLNLLKK